jgi:hypothetical protein
MSDICCTRVNKETSKFSTNRKPSDENGSRVLCVLSTLHFQTKKKKKKININAMKIIAVTFRIDIFVSKNWRASMGSLPLFLATTSLRLI